LTFCCDSRRRAFVDSDSVTLVTQQILRAAAENHMAVIAYCFMPDHLHLLIEGLQDESDCLHFIKLAKQYSGFYYSKARGLKLWQRYGFEHLLRDDELTLVVARYILMNPVRAGLVKDPREYPFLGAVAYTLDELFVAISDLRST